MFCIQWEATRIVFMFLKCCQEAKIKCREKVFSGKVRMEEIKRSNPLCKSLFLDQDVKTRIEGIKAACRDIKDCI